MKKVFIFCAKKPVFGLSITIFSQEEDGGTISTRKTAKS